MSKDVILTGIRSNDELTIGNYFGAIMPLIDVAQKMSDKYQVNIFVPDLHSFTTPVDHSKLYKQTMENLRKFVAAGLPLDISDVRIYRQSFIPAHSELTVILNNFTGFGEMSRMTQFKDKSTKLEHSRISVGLFDYPVLMAADILIYGAKYIPVGDDQSQHLEFTRDIAQRLNKQFGNLFVVPEPVAKQHEFFGNDQGLRIMDLADPLKKMSKSDDSNKGVIFLSDNPDEAADKVLAATTDSESAVGTPDASRPGVANLLQIYRLLKPDSDDVSHMGYKEFKSEVATAVQEFLTKFQDKLSQVDDAMIDAKLRADELKMTKSANASLLKVQKAVGLRQV